MSTESKNDVVGVASHALLAVAPFSPDAYGGMTDADGERVITCNDECPPCTLYKEKMVNADAWFMCPKCGRLGQRMEEASHRQILTANVRLDRPEWAKETP
jgi:uncharacterized Fe-S cluster-containing radical SAM superfamily protein